MQQQNIYDLYRSMTPKCQIYILTMLDLLEQNPPGLHRTRVAFEVVKRLCSLSKTPKAIIMQTGSFWKAVGPYGGLVNNDPETAAFIARRIDQANIPSI